MSCKHERSDTYKLPKNRPGYIVTGKAAYDRIVPLLPRDWVDCTNQPMDSDQTIDFIFENAPRYRTREIRDKVKVYSHLPNGSLLDDKWALSRLTKGKSHHLESHCFRGRSGFADFVDRIRILEHSENENHIDRCSIKKRFEEEHNNFYHGCDVTDVFSFPSKNANNAYRDTWVVKDANSNGAGGIWIVSKTNAREVLESQKEGQCLIEGHRYIAQKYAFPPLLWHGRKLHVRCYAIITSHGSAFIHHKAFLHVANERFDDFSASNVSNQKIHITNCCANSDDAEKFAGEICIDFEDKSTPEANFLSSYFPSIKSAFKDIADSFLPFVRGGKFNGGFEYLGLDFILSSTQVTNDITMPVIPSPTSYLLEINAPPSQDTATGLPHAENLHNEVLCDLIKMWVKPLIMSQPIDQTYGWRCILPPRMEVLPSQKSSIFSRRTFLNKCQWAAFESKECAKTAKEQFDFSEAKRTIQFAREQFPFFNDSSPNIFLENAGGTQVPQQVILNMEMSLKYRDRSVTGFESRERARMLIHCLMNADPNLYSVFFGRNASSLLMDLALYLAGVYGGGFPAFTAGDEIIIYEANHEANIRPWLIAAQMVGAKVVWWKTSESSASFIESFTRYLSAATRIVTLPHASNILGYFYDLSEIRLLLDRATLGRAQIVVDGVSSSPHRRPNIVEAKADWYVLSTHKLFGPHMGVLCASKSVVVNIDANDTSASQKLFENGTVSYESCNGVCGIGEYFTVLANANTSVLNSSEMEKLFMSPLVTEDYISQAYRKIQLSEGIVLDVLLSRLSKYPLVNILEEVGLSENKQEGLISPNRLPIVCFIHQKISSSEIVSHCRDAGVILRHGSFLSPRLLASRGLVNLNEGVVRISLVHYNNMADIEFCMEVLESIDNW